MALDATSQSQCRAVISKVREKYGRLDILCSNTGIFPQCNHQTNDGAGLGYHAEGEREGDVFPVQAALGAMEEQKYGGS